MEVADALGYGEQRDAYEERNSKLQAQSQTTERQARETRARGRAVVDLLGWDYPGLHPRQGLSKAVVRGVA